MRYQEEFEKETGFGRSESDGVQLGEGYTREDKKNGNRWYVSGEVYWRAYASFMAEKYYDVSGTNQILKMMGNAQMEIGHDMRGMIRELIYEIENAEKYHGKLIDPDLIKRAKKWFLHRENTEEDD